MSEKILPAAMLFQSTSARQGEAARRAPSWFPRLQREGAEPRLRGKVSRKDRSLCFASAVFGGQVTIISYQRITSRSL